MALTYEEYLDRLNEVDHISFGVSFAAGLVPQNAWSSTGGLIPSTSILTSDTTPGALGSQTGQRIMEDMYIVGFDVNTSQVGCMGLIDRLAHQGTLNGTLTSEQALTVGGGITRYNPAVDKLKAAAQVWTAVGVTATTATIRYTSDTNVANQVSQPFVFGSSPFNIAGRFLPICPADGDYIKTIEGITLAGSTGTAGDFSVVMYKPLVKGQLKFVGQNAYGTNNHTPFNAGMNFPIAKAGACMNVIGHNANSGGARGHVSLLRVN
jgi:hypothetical protein